MKQQQHFYLFVMRAVRRAITELKERLLATEEFSKTPRVSSLLYEVVNLPANTEL